MMTCLQAKKVNPPSLFKSVTSVALLAFVACLAPHPMEAKPTLEYQVKASYLYNFAQFVEWPSEAFTNEAAPLVIGVLGEDRFDGALDALEGKTVGGRSLTVKRCASLDEAKACHALFISESEAKSRETIFTALKGLPILLVGESAHMARDGAMLNFVTVDAKIKFEANHAAAEHARLKISSKVLKLAVKVYPTDGPRS